MASLDLVMFLLGGLQPAVVGSVLFLTLRKAITPNGSALRSHKAAEAPQAYECATVARLPNLLAYGVFFLSLLVAYLVYDVDLVFFFIAPTLAPVFAAVDLVTMGFFLLCFVVGVFFDVRVFSVGWSY